MKFHLFNMSLIIFLIIILTKCNINKNPFFSYNTNIIKNSSFEINGNTSIKYWFVNNTQIPYFDNDTPPDGGKWSLYLKANWYAPLPKSPSYLVPLPSGEHLLNLSLWGKYKTIHGSAFLILKNNDERNIVGQIDIIDTSWTYYSRVDRVRINANDSLFVLLFGGGDELLYGETHFDLVELKLIHDK